MWTIKEAYTKALGLGLGFDFSRVEYDVISNVIRVDGRIPSGWWFGRFLVNDGEDIYQGVVAEFVGDTNTMVTLEKKTSSWLTIFDGVAFTKELVQVLRP